MYPARLHVLQAAAEVLSRDGRGGATEALATFALRENLRSARHQLAEQQRLTRQQSSHIGGPEVVKQGCFPWPRDACKTHGTSSLFAGLRLLNCRLHAALALDALPSRLHRQASVLLAGYTSPLAAYYGMEQRILCG